MNIFHPPTYCCVGRYVHDDLIDQVIETEVDIAAHTLQTTKGISLSPYTKRLWRRKIANAILEEARKEVQLGMPQLNGFRTVIDRTIATLYGRACIPPQRAQRPRSPLPKRFIKACALFYRCLVLAQEGPDMR